jgi:glyoxalase family protein
MEHLQPYITCSSARKMKQDRRKPHRCGRLHSLALRGFVTKQVHTPETFLKHAILGLHHVTATVSEAQADLDFYRDLLGLRLVKKTVNFDNHSVYHFYYGDERGTPGTLWTTFPYKGWGVAAGRHGSGQITITSFSVPAGSLEYWSSRMRQRGTETHDALDGRGFRSITFADPSGLIIRLVEATDDSREPWSGSGVRAGEAIRGLYSITMTLRDPAPTQALLTSLLGFAVIDETEHVISLAANGDAPGHRIDLLRDPAASPGRNGLGTVHHVAMAIGTAEEQLQLRQELVASGYAVTDVLDRQYFRSIYFREPGGILLEVATMQPGFTVDEPLADLGRELKLPPWEEPHRPTIEKRLPSLDQPVSG